MNNSYFKTAALVLAVMVVAITVPVLTPQAQAISVIDVVEEIGVTGGLAMGACTLGSILSQLSGIFSDTLTQAAGLFTAGLDVPTDDNKHQIDDVVRNCFSYVKDFIVESLKRELLTNLTNEVVRWIQGGGSPRFVDDPLGFMGDTVESSMGRTLQEVGLADNTCAPAYQFNMQLRLDEALRLRGQSFGDRTSCTLGEFLGNAGDGVNVNIGDFANDFRQGSWPAWNRLFSGMENNQFGARAMGALEVSANIAGATYEADLETQIGDGFLGDKLCREWQNIETGERQTAGINYQRESPDGFDYTGRNKRPGNSEWQCTSDRTATPGQTMANTVADSIGSEFDRIVNADELASILGAVFDALVGRIVGEGSPFGDALFNASDEEEVEGVTQ